MTTHRTKLRTRGEHLGLQARLRRCARIAVLMLICLPLSVSWATARADAAGTLTKASETRHTTILLAQSGIATPPANACCTAYAACPLTQLLPVGSVCVCYSPYGPVSGVACVR